MLTPAQLATLKAAIAAETEPTFVALRVAGSTGQMAAWFNEPVDPVFIAWRTRVTQDEIMQNGFDWVRVDNLSVGKARIWEWLFDNAEAIINPSKANVRAGIDEAWKGTQADLAVRAAIYVHCKRNVTRGERVFATGTGTDGTPGMMLFEGQITDQDIVLALALAH